jgi:hypothetical protein
MNANYGEEVSNLKISRIIGEFLLKHIRNFAKRIFYNYYLRDMSLASIELPLGLTMFLFGVAYGIYSWLQSINSGDISTAGTVMLSALPVIIGLQLILAFLGHDIRTIPNRPFHGLKKNLKKLKNEMEL